ncbi:hypothetical protein [Azospirillum sp. SYSU D00513]|uniref:hypothetical protein n=1 Tax=Azospirillum sp. SYSU D00513 TaxID=2812561 RepID=UPI001A964139|nr:hypothetical protein [Azospirillum sp. SYSU D00513]
MADNGLAGVNSLVSGLKDSVNAAVAALEAKRKAEAEASANVQEFQKEVNKSSSTNRSQATDIGILARNTTRLNVVSNLAAKDTVDFFKFRVTSKGEATLGQIGDEGLRVQVMSKLGVVVADSNKDEGKNYENFQSMQKGELQLDRGDYVLRVSRDKGTDANEAKNYALQLSMGSYSKDYDTVVKQPSRNENPYQISAGQQAMLDGLSTAAAARASIPTGLSGTQKLMGSFSLFV